MLSLHAISSAGQAESYYKSVNDYYAPEEEKAEEEREEELEKELIDEQGNQLHQHDLEKIMQGDNGEHLRSVFQGKGAELLGLEGFTKEQFGELLNGKLPDGTMLGKSGLGGEFSHRPGWDATLSAPKSVSIMALVAGDKAIIDAHHKAVENTLKFIEGTATNCRSADGKWVKTNNLTVASFTHSASRNLDAQLHTHNVIMNMTQDEQGKWRSLEPKAIYQIQKQAGAVYRAYLAHSLTHELGYELTPKQDGLYEIKGVPLDLIDTMSSRSKEIDRIATEKGFEDAKGREQAALMTRSAKKNASNKSLNERWQEQSKEYDLDSLIPPNRDIAQEKEAVADPALAAARYDVELAIKHLTTYEAVITKEAVLDFTLKLINGAYTPGHTEKVVDEMIAKKELMPSLVNRDGYKQDISYTTPEAHRKESFAVALMEQGLKQFKAPVVSDKAIKNHIMAMRASAELNGTAELNHGQLDGMKNVLTSKAQFIAIQGYAGVGKTFLWRETKQLAESAKYTVKGFAPTGSAAEKLFQDSGIKSQTIDSFVFQNQGSLNQYANDQKTKGKGTRQEKKPELKADKEIWVIDEAGLANARHFIDIMMLARKSGARVVFQGDGAQLGAIEWGKLFKILQEHGMPTSVLDDILRQKGAVRDAVYNVLDKDYKKAMANLGERVSETEDRIGSLVEDWRQLSKEDREKALIIVPDLDNKTSATTQLRLALQEKNELGHDAATATVLLDSKLSDPQKGDGRFYEPGMIVQFNRENKEKGIQKGDRYTVDYNREGNDINKVSLINEKGERIEWNPTAVTKNRYLVDVYKTKPIALAINDKLRWTKTNSALGLRNADKGKVIAIDKNGKSITVEFDRGGQKVTKTLDLSKDRTFDHGYIETAFGAQGLDSKHVFAIAESWRRNLVNEKSFYVKLSRTKDMIKIYTDNKGKLTKALERTGEKTSAIESQKGERVKIKQKAIEKKSELNWVKKLIDGVADKFKPKEQSHEEHHQQAPEKSHAQEHKETTQQVKEKETHIPERDAPARSHDRER